MIRNMMLGGIGVKHGDILYDTDAQPAAVITGSWHSEGKEPWNIRGRRVWIAVGLASVRGIGYTWCSGTVSSAAGCGYDLPFVENPSTSWKLAQTNMAPDGSGSYVSTQSTEMHMDQSFHYSQTVKDSEELTSSMISYNKLMRAANFCRKITLEGLGTMDLPSIDVLMRIYQARTIIDALDPTASANYQKKLVSWGFGSQDGDLVWSSSEYNINGGWSVTKKGLVSSFAKYDLIGVIPVKEIDAR